MLADIFCATFPAPTMCSEGIPGNPHLVCSSLSGAMTALKSPPLDDKIEAVFILGGARVYEVRSFAVIQ